MRSVRGHAASALLFFAQHAGELRLAAFEPLHEAIEVVERFFEVTGALRIYPFGLLQLQRPSRAKRSKVFDVVEGGVCHDHLDARSTPPARLLAIRAVFTGKAAIRLRTVALEKQPVAKLLAAS